MNGLHFNGYLFNERAFVLFDVATCVINVIACRNNSAFIVKLKVMSKVSFDSARKLQMKTPSECHLPVNRCYDVFDFDLEGTYLSDDMSDFVKKACNRHLFNNSANNLVNNSSNCVSKLEHLSEHVIKKMDNNNSVLKKTAACKVVKDNSRSAVDFKRTSKDHAGQSAFRFWNNKKNRKVGRWKQFFMQSKKKTSIEKCKKNIISSHINFKRSWKYNKHILPKGKHANCYSDLVVGKRKDDEASSTHNYPLMTGDVMLTTSKRSIASQMNSSSATDSDKKYSPDESTIFQDTLSSTISSTAVPPSAVAVAAAAMVITTSPATEVADVSFYQDELRHFIKQPSEHITDDLNNRDSICCAVNDAIAMTDDKLLNSLTKQRSSSEMEVQLSVSRNATSLDNNNSVTLTSSIIDRNDRNSESVFLNVGIVAMQRDRNITTNTAQANIGSNTLTHDSCSSIYHASKAGDSAARSLFNDYGPYDEQLQQQQPELQQQQCSELGMNCYGTTELPALEDIYTSQPSRSTNVAHFSPPVFSPISDSDESESVSLMDFSIFRKNNTVTNGHQTNNDFYGNEMINFMPKIVDVVSLSVQPTISDDERMNWINKLEDTVVYDDCAIKSEVLSEESYNLMPQNHRNSKLEKAACSKAKQELIKTDNFESSGIVVRRSRKRATSSEGDATLLPTLNPITRNGKMSHAEQQNKEPKLNKKLLESRMKSDQQATKRKSKSNKREENRMEKSDKYLKKTAVSSKSAARNKLSIVSLCSNYSTSKKSKRNKVTPDVRFNLRSKKGTIAEKSSVPKKKFRGRPSKLSKTSRKIKETTKSSKVDKNRSKVKPSSPYRSNDIDSDSDTINYDDVEKQEANDNERCQEANDSQVANEMSKQEGIVTSFLCILNFVPCDITKFFITQSCRID